MRLIFGIILAAFSLSLGGCRADQASKSSSQLDSATGASASSSAEASSQPSPEPAPAAANDARPLLVCFGDSLTAGYGADPGQSYPDFLQHDLDASGYKYHVVNEGVSGNTTKDGLDRLDSIVALKPAIVVLEFGGNDGLRGFKLQTTRDNLGRMISTLQAAGAKVVLAGITLPPDYGPDYVNAFDANYTALARQYRVPLLPFLLKDVYGLPGMMQRDNIHATGKGNAVVARNVLQLLTPVLQNR
jgi:acyl-CoA thioesterase-1